MKRNALLSALVISTLFTAVSGCSDTPEEHLAKGRAFMESADYRGAELELKTVLQAQPEHVEARLLLGKAYLIKGEFPAAEQELKKARAKGATDQQLLVELARAYLGMDKAQTALDLGVPAQGLTPQTLAALHAVRAEALLALGKRPEADQALSEGRRLDAGQPDLLLTQARFAVVDKQVPRARELVEHALQRNPKLNDALYLKASLLQADNRPDEALRVYQQILKNDAGQFRAHLGLVSLHLAANKLEAAENEQKAAEKLAPTVPMVNYSRGLLELRRGKLTAAQDAFLLVQRAAPDDVPTLLARATTEYGLGHYEQSIKAAKLVLAKAPDNTHAGRLLAAGQLRMGDVKSAQGTIAGQLRLHPLDAKLLAVAGEVAMQAREYSQAMGYLQRAGELDPRNPDIKQQQASTHVALKQYDQAIADLEMAASLDSKSTEADLSLVMLRLQLRQFDQALQAVNAMAKKLPDNPVMNNLRAAALMGKGDRAHARKELEQALALSPAFIPAATNLARLDIEEKRPDAARKRFADILEQDKNNVSAMLALAKMAASQNKADEYRQWLEAAIKADPKGLPQRSALVRLLLERKDNQKALALAKEGAYVDQDNPDALSLLGATQMSLGDKGAALDTYTRMAAKTPDSAEALLPLAFAQIAAKQLDAARGTLERALKLRPDLPQALDALINMELTAQKPEAALQLARRIQAALPASPLGFDREGDVLMFQKQPAQAARAFARAVELGAGAAGVTKRHQALMQAGDSAGADRQLSGWIAQHPQDVRALSYAAAVYMNTQRLREAGGLYEKLIKLEPENPIVLNNLANLYLLQKDPRALDLAEKANRLAPGSVGIQDSLGWILLTQGQLARGTELLKQAASKAPKVATVRYHYAVALEKSGQRAAAKKELQAALALGHFLEREAATRMLQGL